MERKLAAVFGRRRAWWLHDVLKLFTRCDEFDFGKELWILRAIRARQCWAELDWNVAWFGGGKRIVRRIG